MPARTDNFQKFVKQKKGSAIKEEIKQNKKKEKKERAAAIDAHYERKRAERVAQRQPVTGAPTPGRTAKFAAIKKEGAVAKTGRPNKYPKNNTGNQDSNKGKPGSFAPRSSEAHRPKKVMYGLQQAQNNKTPQGKKVMKDAYPSKAGEASAARASSPGKHPKKSSGPRIGKTKAPAWRPPAKEGAPAAKPSAVDAHIAKETLPARLKKSLPVAIPKNAANITIGHRGVEGTSGEQMPLNKYIAHGGICSRRDAAILVKEGKVTVNDTPATDPGMKVLPTDVVKVGNKKITPSRNFVYILLNKPKDYITTSDDPQGRKTVLDLVRSATDERVYPVGRLDRNTSGVLLLTNDGELAQKLSHPKHEVKKVYEVKLDRALTRGDLDMIASGITLEDGFVAPDVIAYADAKDKSIIGIEIHSGRNRIVRRIFEHLKYDVKGLDRVMYAGLTKKDVQRGNWRFLKDKEIRILKFMNQSFVKIRE